MSSPFVSLQQLIDEMPMATCTAMLEAVETSNIITGAYSLRGGPGACPMLAARRYGAPPHYVPFAEAWDRYTGVAPTRLGEQGNIRYASHRERGVLIRLLKNRIFPSSEQLQGGATCEHCRRVEKIDYYGACAFCGHQIVTFAQPAESMPVTQGKSAPMSQGHESLVLLHR